MKKLIVLLLLVIIGPVWAYDEYYFDDISNGEITMFNGFSKVKSNTLVIQQRNNRKNIIVIPYTAITNIQQNVNTNI